MNCQECGAHIPPEFKSCLVTNTCPACNGKIMSGDLKELINSLAEVMEQMPNNPQGIACWLVSSYKMDKINNYDPPKQHVSKKVANINTNGTNSDKQKAAEAFLARAGVNIEDIPEYASKKKRVAPAVVKNDDYMDDEDYMDKVPFDEGFEDIDEVDKMMLSGNGDYISEDEKDQIAEMVQNSKFGSEKNPTILALMDAQKQRREDINNGVSATDARGKSAGFRRSG
ncbi:MAG: hypothetical protein ACOYMA_00195 [Bacteroidia bacterium]